MILVHVIIFVGHTLITRLLSSSGIPGMLHDSASAWPGIAEKVMVSPKSITYKGKLL